MLKRIFLFILFFSSQAMGSVFSQEEIRLLKEHFFANFNANGSIVASPSKQNPNYYYDWVRDSALAMGLIDNWYESNPSDRNKQYLLNYVSWSEIIQHQTHPIPGFDILGEPKFYIDGNPFDKPWGRPQNDGPALRAFVLSRFAQQLLDQNEQDYVLQHLYNGGMDPQTMGIIKLDLEYTAHHWHDANFDLWEEVYGHHFFTAMAQKNALIAGAALARRLQDEHAARFYEAQAHALEVRLNEHLDQAHHLIQATLPPHAGPQKTLELDSSVILGVLINPQQVGAFSLQHVFVKNTVRALHKQFKIMFPVNQYTAGAILFGRYPGDTYDGYQTNGLGNPWFILTATMAEYYFTLADNATNQPLVVKYTQLGDEYLRLIKKHASDLHLSEQINLITGIQQGAESLTWSYTAVLRAIDMRKRLTEKSNPSNKA